MAGIMVMVAYMGHERLADSIAVFLCGLALLRFAERKIRRLHNSSAFARGAFIGGLLPGGLILVFLAAAIAKS